MTLLRFAKISLLAFVAVALQVSVAAQLPVGGAKIDVVLIATIASGLAAGAEAGAGFGFAVGLLIDLLGAGPVGLTALVYTVVGYASGISQRTVVRSSRLIPVATAGLAAVGAVFANALMGEVLGQHSFMMVDVPRVAVVVTVSTMVLILPARSLMAWAFAHDRSSLLTGAPRW